MLASILRRVALSTVLAASASLCAGCYVETQYAAESPEAAVAYEGYAPQYYDGYVVYYDNVGRPYYYNRGGTYYVPSTYGGYGGLVSHYQTYRPAYYRWHSAYGSRYRSYRYAPTRRAYRR